MKRIFYFITIFICVVGLVGFIFNLKDYDFFTQLELASKLPFNNPIDCFIEAIDRIRNAEFKTEISWWENLLYNPFMRYIILEIYNIIVSLVKLLICILSDIFFGIQLVLVMLGFQI